MISQEKELVLLEMDIKVDKGSWFQIGISFSHKDQFVAIN